MSTQVMSGTGAIYVNPIFEKKVAIDNGYGVVEFHCPVAEGGMYRWVEVNGEPVSDLYYELPIENHEPEFDAKM